MTYTPRGMIYAPGEHLSSTLENHLLYFNILSWKKKNKVLPNNLNFPV